MSHKKLIPLARDIGLENAHVIGHLHCLWYSALEQAEDGDLTDWDDRSIAELAGYRGDAKKFVIALQKHCWLDGRLIHDWIDYAGKYLTSKYSNNDKPKLGDIWAKHGRIYGVRIKKEKPKKKGTVDLGSLRNVVTQYVNLKGWVLDNKDLQQDVFKRNGAPAKKLITLCQGDVELAFKSMAWCKEFHANQGLEWRLDTVVKSFPEFMKSKKKAKVQW